jgi:transcription initiation factor TFIIIB Brf1 subunit/transcription initiation factor TFIIB
MVMAMVKRECPFCHSTNVYEWTEGDAAAAGPEFEKEYKKGSLFCYDCGAVFTPDEIY